MTIGKEVRQGVDVDGYRRFVEGVAEDPEGHVLHLRATGESEAVANRTVATIGPWGVGSEEKQRAREHTLTFGLPEELEGAMGYGSPEERPEAVEVALAALTACVNGTIAYNALRENVPVEHVRTTARIPLDGRVLFGILDADRAGELLGDLEVDVEVTGAGLTDEHLTRVGEYPKRSPVFNLLTRSHPCEPRVTRAGP